MTHTQNTCHSSDIALVLWHFIILFHHGGAGRRDAWFFPAQHPSLLSQMQREGEELAAYPQEGEVSVVLDAGDLQVAHHDLAVLIVLAQGPVLLLQVRQGAQLVLGASTHCKQTQHSQSGQCGTGALGHVRK